MMGMKLDESLDALIGGLDLVVLLDHAYEGV